MPLHNHPSDEESLLQAIGLIARGEFAPVEQLLLQVIANTPEQYPRWYAERGLLYARVWDQRERDWLLELMADVEPSRRPLPVPEVYPRAFHTLAFLRVERADAAGAVNILTDGLRRWPHHPHLTIELAVATARQQRPADALAIYRTAAAMGDSIPPHVLAMALRGCGVMLVELGEFDEAEQALNASLKAEPGNPVATRELEYIEHVRAGGDPGRLRLRNRGTIPGEKTPEER